MVIDLNSAPHGVLPDGWELGGESLCAVRVDGLKVRILGPRTWADNPEDHALGVELLLGRRPYVLVFRDGPHGAGAVRLLRAATLFDAVAEAEAACPLAPLWAQAIASPHLVAPETGALQYALPGER